MQLYFTQSSPYALAVRMTISELGISPQIELIESHPFDNHPDFLAASPLGKVPCLSADGQSIVDSEVICDYLDANYSGGILFNPVYADWRLKSLYSVCSGLMDSSVARRIEIVREKEATQSAFWLQRHSDAVYRSLQYINDQLRILPDEFSILHINLLSALAYLDFRHADIKWREQHAELDAFFEQYNVRPCFGANPLTD